MAGLQNGRIARGESPSCPPAIVPSCLSAKCDLEVLRLDVPVAERQAGGAGAMLVEIRRLEPFALLGGVDGRDVVLARRESSQSILAGLIRPCRDDLSCLRTPQQMVGREG